MANYITPKQLEILILIYRFRFLNRIQIQTILKHKDPKRINVWLKDLTDKQIIGRHYSVKLKENTKPAIYYLMTGSKSYLLDTQNVDLKILKQRIYREKARSQRLRDHSILLANFYLKLISYDHISIFTKTDLATHNYLPFHKPDAYIVNRKSRRYFLEIIDEGTPRFMIRKLVEKYVTYYDAQTWERTTGYNFPKVLLLCPNENIKNFLHRYIAQILEEEAQADIAFYLALKTDFKWKNALEDIAPEL